MYAQNVIETTSYVLVILVKYQLFTKLIVCLLYNLTLITLMVKTMFIVLMSHEYVISTVKKSFGNVAI